MLQVKEKVKVKPYAQGFSNQDSYGLKILLEYDFTIQTYQYTYFSTMDIVSNLGGLASTIKLIIQFITPILVLKFMITFA